MSYTMSLACERSKTAQESKISGTITRRSGLSSSRSSTVSGAFSRSCSGLISQCVGCSTGQSWRGDHPSLLRSECHCTRPPIARYRRQWRCFVLTCGILQGGPDRKGGPAAWAVLEAHVPGRPVVRGIADAQGRIALIFAYPEPVTNVLESPPVSSPLSPLDGSTVAPAAGLDHHITGCIYATGSESRRSPILTISWRNRQQCCGTNSNAPRSRR